jgi:NH3-dependent NAD+ synthetase
VWALPTQVGVPDALLRRQPSADLWSEQADEAEVHAAGFSESFVCRVTERVRNSQRKGRLPVIAEASKHTIDLATFVTRGIGEDENSAEV